MHYPIRYLMYQCEMCECLIKKSKSSLVCIIEEKINRRNLNFWYTGTKGGMDNGNVCPD
jgi:hypothetical protein